MNETIIERIAEAAYEVNRAYCLGMLDRSFTSWAEAPAWQRDTVLAGVRFLAEHPNASQSASHESWLAKKRRDGWKYGPVKEPSKKEHPCCVPYEELPPEQQAKDAIFCAVVRGLLAYHGVLR